MSMTFLMFTHTKKDNYTMVSKLFLFTELKSAMPWPRRKKKKKKENCSLNLASYSNVYTE